MANWIKLTRGAKYESVLVNFALVTHIGRRADGSSAVYFADHTLDDKGAAKVRSLSVNETVEQIANKLNGT